MRSRTIVAILVSVIGMTAWADTETVNGIVWTFNKSGGVATITGAKTTSGVKVSGDIAIPGTLGGASVESVDSYYSGGVGVFYHSFGDSLQWVTNPTLTDAIVCQQ